MNEKYRINILLFKLNKIYPTKYWKIYNLGEGHIYLFYKDTEILHIKKLKSISTIDTIIKFVILCIIDVPKKFGIKKIICKLKKK